MSYILKLAGWYPSRVDAFNGDFVQRHAISIAHERKVIVIFAVKDPQVKEITIEKAEKMNGRLIEYICYYPASNSKLFGTLLSYRYYMQAFKKAWKEIAALHGRPQLVHVNIAWRAGIWAQWLLRRHKLPYVITENWTGYYEADPNNITTMPGPVQRLIRTIFRQSRQFIPVTHNLGERCNQLFGPIPYAKVENAVDTSLFYNEPLPPPGDKLRLVHVSTMGHQKNIDGLLNVLERVAAGRSAIELVLVGPCSNEVWERVAHSLQLKGLTTITGNIPYAGVAAHVRSAHLMVLFSRYENLPCVILEALCCGVPVVSSRVGGIDEVINSTNGRLAESGDEAGLYDAITDALTNLPTFNRPANASLAAAHYSYAAIGCKYEAVYRSLGY